MKRPHNSSTTTRGRPETPGRRGSSNPRVTRRPPRAAWLVAAVLLALATVGSSAATAVTRTGSSPASCADATGATWHVKHYYFKYNSRGAVAPGEQSRLPARGNRYVVNASGTDCALAHAAMRRLTGARPDKAESGRRFEGFFVPPGYGYLFQSPPGFFCAATLDDTHSAIERGDNRHVGYCAHLNHRGAFSWTAATPNPEKYKPR